MRGVEIHFTRRPDDATLAPLRGDRAWSYTGKTKCWYARQTDATVAWAKAFCENFNGGTATTPPVPPGILPSLPEPEREPAPIPVPAPATVCRTEASERRPVPPSPSSRPERKIIRFTDTGHEGIGSSRGIVRELNPDVGTWTPVPAAELAAEREVLQREYLNSQGRAGFYEANDPATARPTSWQLASLPSVASAKEGTTETPISIADLMRPKV